jgi:antitoxin (DNA-binding transcriptional repressor) of toxin-antitoxin stability system
MPMVTVTELRAHFSDYLRRVLAGEVFYITRRGVEIAEFRPTDPTRKVLWDMVDAGELHWSGGKPRLPDNPIVNTGRLVSDIVLEDRGPRLSEIQVDEESE